MPDVPKTCLTCPSLLKADQVITKFGKNIGAPVCGRFGHVLGRPGNKPDQEAKLMRHYGSNCPAHGEPLPGAPVEQRLKIALPDPDRTDPDLDQSLMDMCHSCLGCKNYVSADKVADNFGWTEGMCAAKGKLLLANRLTYEARNCEFRQFGASTVDVGAIALLPEYDEAFSLSADATRAWFKARTNFVDPAEYATDREVDEEDAKTGIRAWRKIVDPEGSGNEVFLPCYDPNFFNEEERKKIPRSGDDEHPELYIDHFGGVYMAAVAWTELDETPAAWGQAGVGKTELFRHLAWLMCIPFYRISITGQTELDDLAGKMHFTEGIGTHFAYGRLPLAWGKPCVLCIDEPNVGPPEVWQFLRPLTDNSKQLVLDMNAGELLDRHTDCYLGMAMNPAWDYKNVGANPISDADANRLFHIEIQMPPDNLEREIIKNRIDLDGWAMKPEQLNMLMKIASDLRAMVEDGVLPITWGVRPQIKVARAMRWFDVVTAYKRAIGDFLEPEARDKLMDAVQAHLTSS